MEPYGHGVLIINGRLGQNTTTDASSPVQIPGTSWSSISGGSGGGGGGQHSLAKKTDGYSMVMG
jgi:hypothetical protein